MGEFVPDSTAADVSSLSPNQAKALNALLTTTTIGAAAEQSGLHISTIKKYLAQEHFSRVYREQRALILQEVVAGLTTLGTEAVAKLESALEAGDINTELRAATRVLDYITKLVELERRIRDQDEIEERLAALEAMQPHSEAANNNGSRRYG
jgi:hypothetical protein